MNDDGHSMPPIRTYLVGGFLALVTLTIPVLSITMNTDLGAYTHKSYK
jgi:hypothetical protein